MKNQACYHCGEDCGKHPVMYDDKPFCCSGCVSVYQILGEGKLYKYYELQQTPGTRQTTSEDSQYTALDSEEIQQQLHDFDDGQNARITFFVPNIHCASCIWLLENLHRLHQGISLSTVNFVKKTVAISYRKQEIGLRQVAELMDSIGYGPKVSLDDANKTPQSTNKALLYRIGVAGFAFGNIMLMSFPEYLSGGEFTEKHFPIAFGWMNLLLSLPIVLYAATDYYVSAWKGLRHRFVNIDVPIALGVLVLFAQSAYEVISQTGPGYSDSLAGLVFFLLLGKWYQNKTYQALSFDRDYRSYFPIAVTRLRQDQEEIIPLAKLQPGDRILVRNQELIPADAILRRGLANIDFSFVTGESNPVRKQIGETIYAGGRQVGSALELEISKAVEQSYLTQLWNQNQSERHSTRLGSLIDVVSHRFTFAILTIATLAGLFWLWAAPERALHAFAAVLIVACPCALALSLPFGVGSTMRLFGRLGLYLKKMEVVEHLTQIDTVVFDKTGTITQSNSVEIQFVGSALSPQQQAFVRSLARQSAHPMSVAIGRALPADDLYPTEGYHETVGQGIEAYINGEAVRLGSEEFVTAKAPTEHPLETRVWVAIGGQVLGYYRIENKYRDGLRENLHLLSQHYSLHLLSGDNAGEKTRLEQLFPQPANLHFEQQPTDKLAYIRQLKAQGRRVLMIGDGLNDAGALLESHVGISIADNIHHFSPACDAILDARSFGLLARLLRFGHTSLRVVKVSYVLSFLYNAVGISIAVSGHLSPIVAAVLMPLSSVSVVGFVTLGTHLMASRRLPKPA